MSNLELKRVVLYKTGLGYFEKHGIIDLSKNNKITLSFKSKVMNDLLKTFSIHKKQGDFTVSGISYESQESNQGKLLEDSLINIPEQNSLIDLLLQLRGMKVKVTIAGRKSIVSVIGLQERIEPVGKKSEGTITEIYVLINTESNEIIPVKLKEIEELSIIDSIADQDFKFFMDIIQTSKKEKNRNLVIFFKNQDTSKNSKDAEFVLTFLQETPAWKVSYRLFLNDNSKDNKDLDTEQDYEQNILLQGWAIIDNILDEEWNNVELSLVSGMPISFKYDSYSPLWINRPKISRNQDLNISNTHSTGTIGRDYDRFEQSSNKKDSNILSSKGIIQKIVQTNKLKGSGFEYKINVPVNVKRNQSSLIPLIQAEGKAQMVSIYNENIQPVNPMRALQFINFTGKTLEEGPISVFKNNIFEGEAVLPFMELEEQQRIPYAIDQGMEIHRKVKNNRLNFHQIYFSSDLWQKYFLEKQTIYSVSNLSDYPKILLIEHPIEANYQLFETIEPFEESKQFYRFQLKLDPSTTQNLVINQRRLMEERRNIAGVTSQLLNEWLKLNIIERSVFDLMQRLLQEKKHIDILQQEISALKAKKERYITEHNRIRNNLDVLKEFSSDKKLRQRYVHKLEKQEAEIEELDAQIEDNLKKIEQFKTNIKDIIEKTAK